jgi:hypothetical protein
VTAPASGSGAAPSQNPSPGPGIDTQLAKLATAAVKRGAIPVALIVIVVAFLLVQDRLDRNDPKLALAPVHPEPDLPFAGPEEFLK